MKRILGLDLGTTSIGWAYVNEAEREDELSSIINAGVRVVPLSTDEQNDFKRGRSITINADRTLKRGARRNLQRYKLRRKVLIKILNEIGFINDSTKLAEDSKDSTHSTYDFRAKATSQKLTKEEFARVLLMINKKRGYKSSRKANNEEEGQLIDGMAIAKRLENENLTPGQLSFQLLKEGKRMLPDYYRSDLQAEFDLIWNFQKQFYPASLMPHHKEALEGLGQQASGKYFEKTIGTERAENKGAEKKLRLYEWRAKAISEKMDLKEVAYVLTEVNNKINQSSGYLGAISDRSKELYFDNLTVGQFLYNQLKENPNTSLKNQVFYRQDYMNEFDAIWTEQSKHYPELTEKIKDDIRNITIFYQRPLKSQKGLINICELEGTEREVLIDGVKKTKEIGPKVIPKSSPLFQHFKIWQNINSIQVSAKDKTLEVYHIEEDTKKDLFEKLNCVESVSDKDFLEWLFENSEEKAENFKVNFKKLEGNRTQSALLKIYEKIVDLEGHPIEFKEMNGLELVDALKSIFHTVGITYEILEFNPTLQGNGFAKQPSYELWHLLYSYTDDTSETGIKSLIEKLQNKFGFKEQHARLLVNVTFQQDYGSLSARAIKKIYPYLEDGKRYDEACALAGYNHSNSITKEDKKNWKSQELKILQKNSLRNPVVEKILNQMIHVVNGIIESPEMGRPEEIRVELARELKKTAEQRGEMTKAIERATKDHDNLREKIKKEFGIPYVSRKDLIKYKLYRELKVTGYKTLYSGTYIKPEDLFTNKFDVEHIIPQSVLFDDSFSNKTLELRDNNLEKGNETALDYCERKGWLSDFKDRVEEVFKDNDGIGYMKRKKLLMTKEEIPEGFLNRDLGNSAYIAKKAIQLLQVVSKDIVSTSGTITAKLRSDWELINVLQELNWEKYEALGLTYYQTNKNGKKLPRIQDWTKRNDHRHHAMDAIAVAFTKRAFIQYLNNDSGKSSKGFTIEKIKEKYTFRDKEGGRKFIKPFPTIREESKKHLERILISHKAKNKVVTNNKNKIKVEGGHLLKKELTPRGQLHKETIYGKSIEYKTKLEKIGGAFDEEKIATVAKKKYRELLLKRLQEFDGDAKKAFTGKNSLSKNPILLNENGAVLTDKVKTVVFEDRFTIRKEITPDLKIDKVVDVGLRKILQKRLDDFNGKPKEAFVNLDENPIWLNEEKGIKFKRITITGVSNAEPLHLSKDHLGNELKDSYGNEIPVDYISTGNNHHVSIYRDENGNLNEEVVSFYEAVIRKNLGQPIINKNHENGWEFLFTMKQNEMFLFPNDDFNPSEIDLKDLNNRKIISSNLFRVQKLSTKNYVFNHHLETEAVGADTFKNKKELSEITYKFYQSEKYLEGIIKVRLNHLGTIVQIGEY
ncbi:type II CRISPR RNA-guided endonuclease Cas9 [Aequorivita antarctica]|uniref:CRISPR-associated endonuclease Cas9 n=1 Tax=Aequorivita antarctica TaxID=153266 RepID=A0A5C6Z0A2_9FLAO|nr:type II CRISPR RNA-guided endonuclease Cas9 [Aequorivita antarctica]TXD73052.1 type II CRISPR RNA-guided endonuclease Cas9 [Aequorivita antarctica]SRX76175.1 CRISPR-associated endonuclease Cas9 [Aequorivita antarctica]